MWFEELASESAKDLYMSMQADSQRHSEQAGEDREAHRQLAAMAR